MKTLNEKAGLAMRKIRHSKDLTIMDIYKACDIEPGSLSRMENNTQSIPMDKIERFCKATKIKPDDFFKVMVTL